MCGSMNHRFLDGAPRVFDPVTALAMAGVVGLAVRYDQQEGERYSLKRGNKTSFSMRICSFSSACSLPRPS